MGVKIGNTLVNNIIHSWYQSELLFAPVIDHYYRTNKNPFAKYCTLWWCFERR